MSAETGLSNNQADRPGVVVTEHAIDVGHDTICAFQFTEASPESIPGPAILYCHGGSMIAGDITSFQRHLASFVIQTGVQIYSMNYRLAPEPRGESLTKDCYAGLLWLHHNAERLCVDSQRIAVMGESVGGGLAAGVALMARDCHLHPPLAKQLLFEPMLDDRSAAPVLSVRTPRPLGEWEDNFTGWTAILGDQVGSASVSPYNAPARAVSLLGLPPTYIDVGQFDSCMKEAESYATRLVEARVTTEFHSYLGFRCGFKTQRKGNSFAINPLKNRIRAICTI